MKQVELYAKVRYAVQIEGLSERAAARRFGIDPRTVAKMMTVLGAAGLPAHEAAGAAEAGCVHRHHRPHSGRGQRPAEEAAAHGQADLRAAAGRARLHGRHHDREGLRGRLAAAGPGDVRAAGASAGARAGRLRRGDRRHRRRGAQDPLLRVRPAALGRLLRGGLSGGDDGSLLRRARAGVHVLRRRAEVDPLRQHQDRGCPHPGRRQAAAHARVQRAAIALPVRGSVRPPGQGQRQGQGRRAGRLRAAQLPGADPGVRQLRGVERASCSNAAASA